VREDVTFFFFLRKLSDLMHFLS